MDFDAKGWALNPATEFIGRLAARYPDRFGRSILTTNFDPLIEVSIRTAGGSYFRTTLQSDGNLSQTEGTGCHVIHLHGYWYGSDTLHTARQLGQARPRLRASLSALLREKLVVVCGYGGWDDAFTEALVDVVRDDSANPEVLWTFFSQHPLVNDSLSNRLERGMDRGRVNLYAGIDCHELFPKIYNHWLKLEPESPLPDPSVSNPVKVSRGFESEVERRNAQDRVLEGDEEDRPPLIEICVGRDDELRALRNSGAKVVFLSGLGGQGKSTLAAKYFVDCQNEHLFSLLVWRDCKEESERFETQLASVIGRLSGGSVTTKELAQHSVIALVDLLTKLIAGRDVLFVFDNVDHYVNLEAGRMVGSTDIFIESLLHASNNCRVVFTCRPSVTYDHPQTLSIRLEGIAVEAAVRLFEQRGAFSVFDEIEQAHSITDGHAFWLDLLAIQVMRRPVGLRALLEEIRSGRGPVPDKTLTSIWSTLRDREQLVLRAMAETVKPESEMQIADYLRHEMNYAKVVRILTSLRAWNLVVVKRRLNADDVLELHPLVRQFIRRRYTGPERVSFIDAIVKVYKRFMGVHKSALGERPTLAVLEYWTQTAELDLAAGKKSDAFLTMAEVSDAFLASANPREYVRAGRLLLSQVNWRAEHAKLKGFEPMFRAQIRNLSSLGEFAEVDALLDIYKATVADRDARFIQYCDLRAHTNWIRGDFVEAIKWGNKGHELKLSTDVDTSYDVEHTLALARRDAGEPELALPTFLAGRSLKEVIDPDELDEQSGAAHYGNIGRCLHFMGQIDGALICYQKSALLLEKNPTCEHVLNQGYIRCWIGELLIGKQQFRLANTFFRAAFLKWEQVSPPKAEYVLRLAEQVKDRVAADTRIPDRDVEKICVDWIFGRTADTA